MNKAFQDAVVGVLRLHGRWDQSCLGVYTHQRVGIHAHSPFHLFFLLFCPSFLPPTSRVPSLLPSIVEHKKVRAPFLIQQAHW